MLFTKGQRSSINFGNNFDHTKPQLLIGKPTNKSETCLLSMNNYLKPGLNIFPIQLWHYYKQDIEAVNFDLQVGEKQV